jgi:WD40 repeat protein
MKQPDPPFYFAGGAIPFTAPSYVVRYADQELYDSLRRGDFCYVLTARQMGKSSLMSRTATLLRDEEMCVAEIDLTAIGQNITAEQWYDGLVYELGCELGLRSVVQECWEKHAALGPLHRFVTVLREAVLPNCPQRIVIFMDEIDAVRSLSFNSDEFFAAIREVYNRRASDSEWNRLAFCLLGMALPSDLIRNIQITPFNIGRRIELRDFTPKEAAPLAHGFPVEGQRRQRLLERALYWTSGHPYLTQKLCQAIAADPKAQTPADVDRISGHLFLSPKALESEFNLAPLRAYLLRRCSDPVPLLDLYARIITTRRVRNNDTDPLLALLKLSGVVRAVGDRLEVRNRIYAAVFNLRWVKEQMPGEELRRQKRAYWRGVLRAATVCGSLAVVMGALAGAALHQKNRAESARQETEIQLYAADMADAHDAANLHNTTRLRELLEKHRADPWRGFEYQLLRAKCDQSIRICQPQIERLTSVAFLPNTSHFVLAGDNGVQIWDAATGKQRLKLDTRRKWAHAAAVSPRGDLLAVGFASGGLQVWDMRSGKPVRLVDADVPRIQTLAFSPNGKRLAVGHMDGTVRLWQTADWSSEQFVAFPSVALSTVAFDPNRNVLATADFGGTVQLWDAASRKCIARLRGYGREVRATFSPNGQWLAVTLANGSVELWDSLGRHKAEFLIRNGKAAECLAFSANGHWLAAGSSDTGIEVWDLQTHQSIQSLNGHEGTVRALAFSSDGQWLASANTDGTVRIWGTTAFERDIRALPKGGSRLHRATLSPNGKFVATRDMDGRIRLHDVETGKILWTYHTAGPGSPLQFTPQSRELVIADGDARLHFWDIATRREVQTSPSSLSIYGAFCFSLNGRLLAFSNSKNQIFIWDRKQGRTLYALPGREEYVRCMAFSPDGTRLAFGCDDHTLHIWEVGSQRAPRVYTGHRSRVNSVVFAPNGATLASSSYDATIKLWNLTMQREVLTLPAQQNEVLYAAFDPSGETLSSVESEGMVRFWRTKTHQP